MMRHRRDLPTATPGAWSALSPPDSFYARLAAHRDELVTDGDYAALSTDSRKGRPSLPPSLVVLTMLLQYHDDCSDAEAEARLRFDLRWKHALGLPLEAVGFDATVVCHFRRKLLAQGLERALFDRLVTAAREAGLITKDAAQVVDSRHVLGAAGGRDTDALIRGGIRKLLRALGDAPSRRAALPDRLAWYLDPAAPEKPELDWDAAAARAAHLANLVEDARTALVLPGTSDPGTPAVAEAAALLAKIVADDVEVGPPPGPKRRGRPRRSPPGAPSAVEADGPPRLRHGVAPDRVVRVVDPEMRVGHKSERQQWAGYKVQVAEEPTSELLTAIDVRPANEHDAASVVDLIIGQAQRVGLRPRAILGDGAYGTADVRAELGQLGVEVVAKLRPATDGKHIGKDEFVIDLAANGGAGSVTCPAGVATTDYRMARDSRHRPVKLFRFPLDICGICRLREHCLGGPSGRLERPARRPPGRQVQLHSYEATLQAARAVQRTPEQRQALKARLRPRAKIERKIAELVRRHGLRWGRYLGRAKTALQAAMTAAMVNAKRLLTLAAGDAATATALWAAFVAGASDVAMRRETICHLAARRLTARGSSLRRWRMPPMPPGLRWSPTKSAAS
jgi:transposase